MWQNASFAQVDQVYLEAGATANSVSDAVDQNNTQIIQRFVFGGRSAGQTGGQASSQSGGQATGTSGAAAFAVTTFPTGRLRSSDHDGLHGNSAFTSTIAERTHSYEAEEESVFANVAIKAPWKVFGGEVRYNVLAGYNHLDITLQNNRFITSVNGKVGDADNESFILGFSSLWNSGGTYFLSTTVGFWGETDATDFTVFADGSRASYDTDGSLSTWTLGQVLPLGAANTSVDFRGSLAYAEHEGERVVDPMGNSFKAEHESFVGTFGITLFSNCEVSGGVLRPYVQGFVRHEFDWETEVDFISPAARFLFEFERDENYAGFETGLNYTSGNVSVGGAFYMEGSEDENTFGGRLGATIQLN